jgi:N-methylhydantoinase B
VESLEQDYPFMRVEEYALRPDSAGAGERRGGLGARRVYLIIEADVTFNAYWDRFRIAPWGLFGGEDGARSRFTIEREGQLLELDSKVNLPLLRGDRLIIETAGGGGYGDPHKRNPALVSREVKMGLLSPTRAADVYRVPG